jgi:hypothetical protein
MPWKFRIFFSRPIAYSADTMTKPTAAPLSPSQAARRLQAEILQVVGCTEPAAIGYALRTLVRRLPRIAPWPPRVELRLSSDAFRNATTAVVPRLLLPGILPAAAAGLASRADDFNVFADFDLPRAQALLADPAWLDARPVRRRGLYVRASFPDHGSSVVLARRHDHIERLVLRGRDRTPKISPLPPPPTLSDAFALARLRHPRLEAIALDFILRQVPPEPGYPLEEQIARRIAGRMSGYEHPVMTLTGSGNQGIFIALPYRHLHAQRGNDVLPALVFSLLAQIHLSQRHSRLSDDCGLAVKAAPALAGGLAFLAGEPLAQIRRTLRDVAARLAHIPCEGAEPACGGKALLAFRQAWTAP